MALNLGDIEFSVGANTANLDAAVSKLLTFTDAVDNAAQKQGDGAAQVAAAYRRQEAAMVSATTRVQALNQAIANAKAPATLSTQATVALQQYIAALSQGTASTLGFQRANERLNLALGLTRNQLSAFNTATEATGVNNMLNALKGLSTAAVLLTGPLGGVAARLAAVAALSSRFGTEVAVAMSGVLLGGLGLDKLAKGAVAASKEVDTLRDTLQALSGNSLIASASLQTIENIANKSGESIKAIGDSYVRFNEAVQGTHLAGAQGTEAFTTIAEALGKIHAPAEQVTSTFNSLNMMMSNVMVSTRQIRSLNEQIPGSYEAIIKAAGGAGDAFAKQLKQGSIMAEDLIPIIAKAYKAMFGLNTDGQVDTYEASINRMHNANMIFFNSLDQTVGFTAGAQHAVDTYTAAIDFLAQHMQALPGIALAVVAAFASWVTIAFTLSAVSKGLLIVEAALAALNISLGAGAIAGFASLLAGWPAIILAVGAGIAVLSHTLSQHSDQVKDNIKAANDYADALNGVNTMTDNVAAATASKLQASIQELEQQLISASATLNAMNINLPNDHTKYGRGGNMLSNSSGDIDTQKAQVASLTDQLDKATAAYNKLMTAINAPAPAHGQSLFDASKIADEVEQAHREYQKLIDDTNAFKEGGQSQLDKQLVSDEELQKIDQYRKLLERIGSAAAAGLPSIQQYSAALKAFDDIHISNERADAIQQSNNMMQKAMDATAGMSVANERLAKEQDTVNNEVLAYTRVLQKTGESQDEVNLKIAEYTELMQDKIKTDQDNKTSQEGIKMLNDVLTKSFDDLGKSVATMLESGKFNMKSFRDVAVSAIDDLIQALVQLALINPILNAVFGANSSTGQFAPTLLGGPGQSQSGAAGAGGILGSLGGALGGSAGSLWAALAGGSGTGMTPMPAVLPALDGSIGSSVASTSAGSAFGALGDWIGGFFANGGDPPVGVPSIIGENGPELWTPPSSGTITSNSELTDMLSDNNNTHSGGDTHVHLNIQTGVSQTVRAEIQNLLPSITTAAKSAVLDAKVRGGKFAAAFN